LIAVLTGLKLKVCSALVVVEPADVGARQICRISNTAENVVGCRYGVILMWSVGVLVAMLATARLSAAGSFAPPAVKSKRTLISECAECHEAVGNSHVGMIIPRIDGLNAGYLEHALRSMSGSKWKSPVMSPIAESLSPSQIKALAAYYAKRRPAVHFAGRGGQNLRQAGFLLASEGDWKKGIPACTLCHGEDGVGIGRNFPRLAGQSAAYIRSQIYAWRSGTRSDDPLGLMATIAKRLDRAQINEVARYFSNFPDKYEISMHDRVHYSSGFIDSHGRFVPSQKADIPSGPFGEMVRLGANIFVHTRGYARKFTGNALSCENCHIDAGRLEYSAPMWAAYVAYPAYRKKNGRVISFAQRLQDCFKYSMNGKAPSRKSKVLLALETYSFFLARGAPTGKSLKGRGYPELSSPKKGMSYGRGRVVFREDCALCHGYDGQGRHTEDGTQGFPPLWGGESYNWGAGMANIEMAARFIKANMPLGLGGMLTVQQSWDVASYIDSHIRPEDPRFDGSVSTTRKRYHNSPTSMYGRIVNGIRLGEPMKQ
jgi:thiosulfate dehydrogenase